jgi:hypothetical protein
LAVDAEAAEGSVQQHISNTAASCLPLMRCERT